MVAHLHRGLSDSGHLMTVLLQVSQVAQDEDFG
jgi:hypothetical protein